jgi:hypothetical protein
MRNPAEKLRMIGLAFDENFNHLKSRALLLWPPASTSC